MTALNNSTTGVVGLINQRITPYKKTWQECQFWNRTFDEELDKVDIYEIRGLVDNAD